MNTYAYKVKHKDNGVPFVRLSTRYCKGIKELRKELKKWGINSLHYSRNAKCYMGYENNFEYFAYKVGI